MKTAFSAFVFGEYERFIPFYSFSISKIYPNSAIIIFYQGELSKSVKKQIINFPNVIIYDNFYADKLSFNQYKIKNGGGYKLLRFLISGDYFKDYDYVYFGDVDIMILREEQSLFDFHSEQAKLTKVPFSNKVRTLPEGGLSKRLTGLHFVEVKPYFEKIQPIIDRVLADVDYREHLLTEVNRDEEFLYKLNLEAFSFSPERLSENIRPWHGFHLGLVRGKKYLNKQTIVENSSISIENLKTQLSMFNKFGDINELLTKFTCVEVYNTYKFLGLSLPMAVKIKYQLLESKAGLLKSLKIFKSKILNE